VSPLYSQANVPAVVFTLDFPGSEPSHYELSVSSDGHASYSSQTKSNSAESDPPDTYHTDFSISPSTVSRIFELTKRANYFSGELESKKKVASTGAKTLAYKSSDRTTHATYNYSQVAGIEDLTKVFQNISATLEFARRLQDELRFQKLALDDELKKMEEMANRGDLMELSIASSILQKISSDSTIMNVSRSRAQRLLSLANQAK
jgi:hypothetical protein